MNVLALVTARGGSKRLPGKNTAYLDGKPMVWHVWNVLNQLRERRSITLRLSTDSQEIADCWPEADRPSDLRPAELATDEASSQVVIAYEMGLRPECDVMLLLQPTSPLVSVEDLEACLVGIESGKPSMVGVTKMRKPSGWAMQIRDHYGYLQGGAGTRGPNRDDECQTAARMVEYVPMGMWAATRAFLDVRGRVYFPGESWPVIVPEERAVDIDAQMDLDVARMVMARRREERERVVWNTVTTDGY